MIFQFTHQMVLAETKTQTRRVNKVGDFMSGGVVFNANLRTRFAVGQSIAVQPGRTQKAVARIRITRIRQEDVRNISDSDVRAEGFTDYLAFLKTWLGMHDKVFAEHLPEKMNPISLISNRHGIRDLVMMQPAERYLAWVIDFELVTP